MNLLERWECPWLSWPRLLKWAMVSLLLISMTGCTLLRRDRTDGSISGNQSGLLIVAVQKDFVSGISRRNLARMAEAEKQALEFGRGGEPVGWTGDRGRASGSVTAFQPFRVGQASCRRFEHSLSLAGETKGAAATACRRNGGPWRLVQ